MRSVQVERHNANVPVHLVASVSGTPQINKGMLWIPPLCITVVFGAVLRQRYLALLGCETLAPIRNYAAIETYSQPSDRRPRQQSDSNAAKQSWSNARVGFKVELASGMPRKLCKQVAGNYVLKRKKKIREPRSLQF